ncbi:MAG: hypothetical protein ABI336_13675, partial [Humibacillus sp.]
LAVGASLLLLLLAVVGAAGLTGRRPRLLAVSCLVGPALGALLLATPTGLRVLGGAQSVPGVALLRDTHRWLGLGSVTTAVLAPMGLLRLLRMVRRLRLRRPDPSTAATVMRASRRAQVSTGKADWLRSAAAVATVLTAVSLALLSAPDAALRLHAAYRPTALPPSWSKVVEVVGERHALLLPWQPLRAVEWSGAGPFLDPLPRALHGEVTLAQDLVVERAGRIIRVGAADPPESAAWERGDLDPAVLRRLGIDVVVEWLGTPGRLPASHPGLVPVLSTEDFVVWSTRE